MDETLNTTMFRGDEEAEATVNLLPRRPVVMTLLAGGLLFHLGTRRARAQTAVTTGQPTETDILNFALNLEYLEAEFYSYAVNGTGIDAPLTGGVGTAGATTGGAKATFSDATVAAVAAELAADELAHVQFLRAALGANAVAKPAINLAAQGNAFASDSAFLTASRALEDIGVSAYAGGARYLQSRDILEAAARILGTESLHAGNIRHLIVRKSIAVPAIDGLDIVPTASKQIGTDPNTGLAVLRTSAQVITDAAPFFPNGLNGNIR